MKNDDAVTAGLPQLFIFLVISLTFSSVTIAWFLFQIYGVTVAGIALPDYNTGQKINFLIDNNTEYVYTINGNWEYTTGGRRALNDDSYLLLEKIQFDGIYYRNEYTINNYNEDYGIVLIHGENVGTLEVLTRSDGFYIRNSMTFLGLGGYPDIFYPYPNANKIANPKILCEYSPVTNSWDKPSLKYYINGEQVLNIPNGVILGNIHGLPVKKYYGGVHAVKTGLTITDFVNLVTSGEGDIIQATVDAVTFFYTVLKIAVWNVDTIYLPWELNLIFIKTQTFGIVLCVYLSLRG